MLLHHGDAVADLTFNPKADYAVTARSKGKVIWTGVRKSWHPWKLVVADVDGDGNEDFLVGLFMVSRHSPKPLHTVFVFGFDGDRIYPKWKGSRLSRDFVDFTLAKDKKGDKILTLDRLLNGRFALSCYLWNGFGFRKVWERGAWKQARLQESRPGSVIVATESGPVTISTEG